ncbi:response regulator [Planctomicrobium sp. SH664]|uniref:response regulator n=1 Tax=Planctomicrobium sp. SH664 TaxID=3448125 RepID=UPI003F5C7D4B
MHALIIDDSRAMRRILQQIVEPLGFRVSQAAHGREGIAQLDTLPDIDVVLVDWNMPEMNGLEFVQALRTHSMYSNLKVVMVTTETEPRQMARALMAGVDEFVMKPFTPEILIDKLRLIGAWSPPSVSVSELC